MHNQQANTTPEQQEAATQTITFIKAAKTASIINFILTGIIIVLTIINVVIAINDKCYIKY